MPQRLGKTKKHRALKVKKHGAKTKHARENKGTTSSFPLTGPIPSLHAGRPIKAELIDMPKAKAPKAPAKAKTAAPAKSATKPAATARAAK